MFDLQRETDNFNDMLQSIGSSISINGVVATAILTSVTARSFNGTSEEKKIRTLQEIKCGDLIDFDNKKWLVTSQVSQQRNGAYFGEIKSCNYTVIFNENCQYITVPCIIETQVMDIQNGQYMYLPDGKMYVHMQENQDTLKVKLGDRFIKFGQAFKVTGIDRSKKGTIILSVDLDQVNTATDDMVNEVADGLTCKIDITNTDPISVYTGSTTQLTWTSPNNAPVTFSSSDTNIATVDANGLITGVNVGNAVITCSLTDNVSIKDTMNVGVQAAPVSYSITITSSNSTPTEIKSGQSKTYNANVYSGSTLITDGSQPVSWQLFADDQVSSTTLASITSQNGTSATVQANSNSQYGYCQLKATLNSNNTIIAWYRIQIKSLF